MDNKCVKSKNIRGFAKRAFEGGEGELEEDVETVVFCSRLRIDTIRQVVAAIVRYQGFQSAQKF